MRRIPGTMATQHPDNASAPYWDKAERPFVSVHQEIDEALTCFQDLGVSEYMWDWEGKHADAAVIDRLFSEHFDYFSKTQLGRDKFLTFRIPNIWEEKGYNLLQAMTVILSGEDFAHDLKFGQRPLFEVILPMTERPEQLMRIHKLFQKLAHFKSTDFTKHEPDNEEYLELIPLVESAEGQMKFAELLYRYTDLHQEHFGRKPKQIRTFLAGSDSALSSGFLTGIIGNKLGLVRLHEFSESTGIATHPIFGFGSLLFRGGLAPTKQSIDRFLKEFPGVRTVTVQSAFRYDYPKEEVKGAIARLERELPKHATQSIKPEDQKVLEDIGHRSAELYKQTLDGIIPDMQHTFTNIPKRRDRRQHIGLLSYSRSMGAHSLPRAITFTGSFYSVGIPPELIAAGRTLASLSDKERRVLESAYPSLGRDYAQAGRYLNKGNLKKFAEGNNTWKDVSEDVAALEAFLGVTLGPQTEAERRHEALTAKLVKLTDDTEAKAVITEMAELRRSLG
jgi:phosphoenolpyruvate carboxylase